MNPTTPQYNSACFSWAGTSCQQPADVHQGGQLSDCAHEGGERSSGALCRGLHHDEPPHVQGDFPDNCAIHGGEDLQELRTAGTCCFICKSILQAIMRSSVLIHHLCSKLYFCFPDCGKFFPGQPVDIGSLCHHPRGVSSGETARDGLQCRALKPLPQALQTSLWLSVAVCCRERADAQGQCFCVSFMRLVSFFCIFCHFLLIWLSSFSSAAPPQNSEQLHGVGPIG